MLGASAAWARPRVVPLPWPPTVLPATPPLAPPTSGVLPLNPRFAGAITNRERVVVGIDETGSPVSVRALQTIVIGQPGDYVFAVPAPVRSVTPGPGTRSPPGQRLNQILWEGFSPGRRVLAAWADLRVAESAGSLPLRIRVETDVDGNPLSPDEKRSGELRVAFTATNVTVAKARSFTANPDPLSLAQVLDGIREAVRQNVFAEGLSVGLRGPQRALRQRISAPLHVEGALKFAPGTAQIAGARNGTVRFSVLLDGLRTTELRLRLHGRALNAAPPKVELRVKTARIADLVPPPAGSKSWVSAKRRGKLGRPRRLLARTIALELTYARKRQYDMFLASPERSGPSSTTYVYRTAAAIPATALGPGSSSGGGHTLAWIVLGLCLAAAVPAAAVIWAHS